jgi:hypothetical protein
MIQAEYPPKMLPEILGHASITTTPDLNGHLYPGDMDLSFHVDCGPRAWQAVLAAVGCHWIPGPAISLARI